MAVTASDIKDCFTQFSSVSPDLITKALAQAGRRVNTTQWGSRADDGILYLTAHLLSLLTQGDGLASGPVASQKVDDVSQSFHGSEVFQNSALGATAYGRYFLDLQRCVFSCRKL